MELETVYESVDIKDTCGPRTLSERQDEARKHRRNGCVLLMTVCLGLICVLLVLFITLRERQPVDLDCKNTLEGFNETLNQLQIHYTELMIENMRLQNSFGSLSREKLELQGRVDNLTTANGQLQRSVEYWSQKILELETKLIKLSGRGNATLFISSVAKSWSESRQYCRNHGADLVVIKTEGKQRHVSSLVKALVWIGLSDIESEGNMKWVDYSPLNQGFWEKNEPNDVAGDEDCVELNPEKSVLNNWNDVPCSAVRPFICEN